MAIKLSASNIERINEFNTKYGVNFNVDEYLSKASKTSPNESLKTMFADMYKKVLKDELGKEERNTASANMFYDFNDYIIRSLKNEFAENNKQFYPHKNAGMSKLERYRLIEVAWNDLPKNDIDLIADKYKNGEIRIRDMVEYANSKTMYSKLDSSTTTIMASYAEALKNVNATRSFFWKVFHPFRNHAEKRDAKLIQSIVTEINGENAYKAAARRAGDGLRNFSDIKSVTTHSTLGVYKVEEYDPNKKEDLIEALDPVLDSEKIAELQGHEKRDELNFDVNIFGNNTKEKLSIDSLKEQPFASKESDKKIDEAAKSAPNLQK